MVLTCSILAKANTGAVAIVSRYTVTVFTTFVTFCHCSHVRRALGSQGREGAAAAAAAMAASTPISTSSRQCWRILGRPCADVLALFLLGNILCILMDVSYS